MEVLTLMMSKKQKLMKSSKKDVELSEKVEIISKIVRFYNIPKSKQKEFVSGWESHLEKINSSSLPEETKILLIYDSRCLPFGNHFIFFVQTENDEEKELAKTLDAGKYPGIFCYG